MEEKFMRQALALAKKGKGRVSPNPLVGAVVVKGRRIIGAGYHRLYGDPHAEVEALAKAGKEARGATLYVNLEPCHHFGKTPPCTRLVAERGLGRIVVGMADPNPLVAGKGIKFLRQHGIQVQVGLLEEECRRLNESFIKYILSSRPFVILKLAATLDGKIATRTGESKWITNEQSRRLAHELRGEVDAIMVGVGTVMADDPLLTYRGKRIKRRRELVRLIADSTLRIPLSAQVLKPVPGAATLLVCTALANEEKLDKLKKMGVEVLVAPAEKKMVDLDYLMEELGRRQIASLLIEGGSSLAASAIKAQIADKVLIFYSPRILGGTDGISLLAGEGPDRLEQALGLHSVRIKRLGEDFLLEGYL